MEDIAIQINDLGKCYRVIEGRPGGRAGYGTLRDSVAGMTRKAFHAVRTRVRKDGVRSPAAPASNSFWALDGINLNVIRGEVMGLIGANGAGKSTLLKVLARITPPTKGWIEVQGTVGSLLEVGTGFHPELTGRENVFLSGSILGMSRLQVQAQIGAILGFAGIERFADTPVKHYSSGMYMRLAFAVAAHLESDILLVDEVLAVGDAEFQKRCLRKMNEVAQQGRTIIFVSHSMSSISALCDRVALLSQGRVAAVGAPDEIISRYVNANVQVGGSDLSERTDREGSGLLRAGGVALCDWTGEPAETVLSGMPAKLLVTLERVSSEPLKNVTVEAKITDSFNHLVTTLSTYLTGFTVNVGDAVCEVECEVPWLALAPDRYAVNLLVKRQGEVLDKLDRAMSFTVLDGDLFGSGHSLRHSWHGAVALKHEWRQPADQRPGS